MSSSDADHTGISALPVSRIFSDKFEFDLLAKNSTEARSSGSFADPFSRALDTNKVSSEGQSDAALSLWRGLLQDQVATLTREVDSLRSVNSQNEARMAQVMQFLEKHQHALALEPKERQRCLEKAVEHVAHERAAREQQIRGAVTELRESIGEQLCEQKAELRRMVGDLCQQEREQTKTMVARARQILDSDESLRLRLQNLFECEMISKEEFKGEFQRLEKLSHDMSQAYTEENLRKGEAISRCEDEIRRVASHFETETRRFSEALEKVVARLPVRRAVTLPDDAKSVRSISPDKASEASPKAASSRTVSPEHSRAATILSRAKSPEQAKTSATAQLASSSDARAISPVKKVIASSPSRRVGSTSPLRARAASPVPRTSALTGRTSSAERQQAPLSIVPQATGRPVSPVRQGSPVRPASPIKRVSPIRPGSPIRALSPSGGLLLGGARSWAFGNPQAKVTAVAAPGTMPLLSGKSGLAAMSPRSLTLLNPVGLPTSTGFPPGLARSDKTQAARQLAEREKNNEASSASSSSSV
mmetsp:Transcript_159384/g.305730  ORF Transcript_159384/g.305730 Transcript_159384/m.305730 type:complete len:534 (-) Transcript_159384:37-1638(-)